VLVATTDIVSTGRTTVESTTLLQVSSQHVTVVESVVVGLVESPLTQDASESAVTRTDVKITFFIFYIVFIYSINMLFHPISQHLLKKYFFNKIWFLI
jgi:hypothetical protein